MKDKEMIEDMVEIAKLVNSSCMGTLCKECDAVNDLTEEQLKGLWCNDIKTALNIYNAGYRKIDKDSVVLTFKELEEDYVPRIDYVFAEMDYEHEKNYMHNLFMEELENARKETAEKILNDMYNEILSIEKIYKDKQSKIYSFNDTDGSIVYKMSVDLNLQFCEYAKGFIQRHAKQFRVEIKE